MNNDINFSVIDNYGEVLTDKKFITNPAIARNDEIKKTIITLLTPDKSALLVGKPGIGKTAIVEGIAYLLQNNQVPEILKGYKVVKINSPSLVGSIMVDGKEELIMSMLVRELKTLEKTILFVDEIHTLIGRGESMLKAGIDRGEIKAIGATTTVQYDNYLIRDRAFLRRFEKIDVSEPSMETTVEILMKTIPKYVAQSGIKFAYNDYIVEMLIKSIVNATSEYKRVYGLSAMYPDVAFSVLSQAFSQALFRNSSTVNIIDVYNAIKFSKRIYPDSIIKELNIFRTNFEQLANSENVVLEEVKLEEIQNPEEII